MELDLDLGLLQIESDSKVLVDMLNTGSCSLWKLQRNWKEVLGLVKKTKSISHQFREGNAIANLLANKAVKEKWYCVFRVVADMPKLAKGNLQLEKYDLPYIRL